MFDLDNIRIGIAKEVDNNVVQREEKYHGMILYLYEVFDDSPVVYAEKITRDQVKAYNLSESKLWETAKNNTFADTKIFGSNTLFPGPNAFYVVTNTSGFLGASSILNTDEIRKEIGAGKYFVCPSSTHEMLLVPADKFDSIDEVSALVASVNAEVVDPADRLIDEAFILQV